VNGKQALNSVTDLLCSRRHRASRNKTSARSLEKSPGAGTSVTGSLEVCWLARVCVARVQKVSGSAIGHCFHYPLSYQCFCELCCQRELRLDTVTLAWRIRGVPLTSSHPSVPRVQYPPRSAWLHHSTVTLNPKP